MSKVVVRAVRREDLARMWELLHGLADYERLPVAGSAERLGAALFDAHPKLEGLVAEIEGALVGYAIYYTTYSTFRTRPAIWLEDLFVLPATRGAGAGKALMAELARIARSRGCFRMDWNVLDWNEPAMGFYRKMGAGPVESDWVQYGLDESALAKLAEERE